MVENIDIIEMMNADEKCKKILQGLNEQCAKFGIKPESEEYQVLREMTILKIMQHHEGIQQAIARSVYNEINAS